MTLFHPQSISPYILKRMILLLIAVSDKIQLTVKAVICDQEASHRSFLNSLGVSEADQFFLADSGNIHAIYDVPYYMKKYETIC